MRREVLFHSKNCPVSAATPTGLNLKNQDEVMKDGKI
jgi:hypothetical protein